MDYRCRFGSLGNSFIKVYGLRKKNVFFSGNEKNEVLQEMKCICYYNVYILIVKLFIPAKIKAAKHFEKASMFTRQNSHT